MLILFLLYLKLYKIIIFINNLYCIFVIIVFLKYKTIFNIIYNIYFIITLFLMYNVLYIELFVFSQSPVAFYRRFFPAIHAAYLGTQ